MELKFVCVCVWQVQPGRRSEVRGDRARVGDRLMRLLPPVDQQHKGLRLTHKHTPALQENQTTCQSDRKLQENWEYLKQNFDAVLSFFKTTFHICFFSLWRNKSSSSVESWIHKSSLTMTFFLKYVRQWEETNPRPSVSNFSFKLQGPKSSTSRFHTTVWTLFVHVDHMWIIRGSYVDHMWSTRLSCCVFIQWTEPATRSLSVC